MQPLAVIPPPPDYQPIIQLVTDALTSPHSQVMYAHALHEFFAWREREGRPDLTKALVQRYKAVLQAKGLSASTINQRLSAIRKLAREGADNGWIDPTVAAGIGRAAGVKSAGVRSGNWLDRHQAQTLLNAPDVQTLKGLRDRAILAMLLGAGLRRSEASALTFAHIQQRDGRWVIVDLVGKGKRVRSVPIPSWAKAALDEWARAAQLSLGPVFCRVSRGDHLSGSGLTAQAVQDVVKAYATLCGFELAAHDLRRTFAKLAHKGGAPVEQIQISLGHASLKTTERYLGVDQDLTNAPCDRLGLRLE